MPVTLNDFFPIFEKDEPQSKDYLLLKQVNEYYENLLKDALKVYEVARKARSKGLDPTDDVEIPIVRNMAERVEKIMNINGLASRILELEEEGISREKMCFIIAEEIISGKFGHFDKIDAIEKAIRTAVAIITEGVVAAPIEGIAKIKIDRNYDGSNFLRIYYTGPIRSAGGTAQVISVLVGDFVRRKLGIDRYKPTEEEILRYIEEIPLYKKIANLQYLPSDEEIRLIVSNCPICIDGEPTEDVEVSGYRDLERVETNRVRGGMALVIAEGIAMKAPKIKKILDEVKLPGWDWIEKLIKEEKSDSSSATKPKDKYLSDIVAGRPVLSHPSRKGGFRLRYGRARNSGYATVGINPATMIIADEFIAIGTQLKIEKPGKAGCIVPVTSIEGPTVRLKNGDVVKINSVQDAMLLKDEVDAILDLGEILINFGDFLENNHPLLPSSYVYEWWIQEVRSILPKGNYEKISEDLALKLCDEYNVPLHPDYTYMWHDITVDEYKYLRDWVSKGKIEGKYGKSVLMLPYDDKGKNILEKLLLEHKVRDNNIIIEKWKVFIRCLGLNSDLKPSPIPSDSDVLKIVNKVSGLIVRAKAPTRIGARMGRPEKAKERKMSPPPHILFPVSLAGGKTRDIKTAMEYSNSNLQTKGEIEVELCCRICTECGKETFWLKCDCGGKTVQIYYCPRCGIKTRNTTCPRCKDETVGYTKKKINIKELYEKALENLGERVSVNMVKGVIGLTSKNKIPERLEKGILRAKHGVYVFKDGTIRFDATDLPLTHFKPSEIKTDLKKLKELGYKYDYKGNELKNADQIVELFPQDLIIPKSAAEYFVRVAKFIDDLLVKFYKMEPFYNVNKPEDLIGHLVIGLAPHTSAGVLGRIIGFADINACYAHPYFHAAKRRNCDGDEDSLILLLDALLNFSKEFLPDKRGGKMDAPLVLTAIIDPKEVDSEVHNMDIVSEYPLEFYQATLNLADPKELVDIIERVENRIYSDLKYCSIGFTHDTDSIVLGVKESSYKSFETMHEKVKAQMKLAERIVAVDENDVAEKVITSHFLPDIVGNLRAFSRQEFRCTSCNEKYRRIPLNGKCVKCGGNLTLSVHSGSICKYLEISKYLAQKYKIKEYTAQRLKLIEKEIESIFEDESKKQVKISDFFAC